MNEIQEYKQMAIITIKPIKVTIDSNKNVEGELIFRFIPWDFLDDLIEDVNSKKVFKIGDEVFPSRNFEKAEKHNGIVPDKRILTIVGRKILKYRSTFHSYPNESQINKITENAMKELNL